MVCPFCGMEIIGNIEFCTSCENKLPSSEGRLTHGYVQQKSRTGANSIIKTGCDIATRASKRTVLSAITVGLLVIFGSLFVVMVSGACDGLLNRTMPASNEFLVHDGEVDAAKEETTTELTTNITTAPPMELIEIEIGGQTVRSDVASLDLGYSDISDIAALRAFTNLTRLNLSDNQISDIEPLEKLTTLKELYISDNQISDIKPLQSLVNLNYLYIGNNQINDIAPLESLSELTSLSIYKNQISDIAPLVSLTNLTYLDIGYNQISDITPVGSLTNLTELGIGHNLIYDITPLKTLTNLTLLYIQYNQIDDITPLKSLINLKELLFDNNPLTETQIDELRRELPEWDT